MRYRKLGVTGLVVSEIGFGGWGIGGALDEAHSYGITDDQESLRALQRAFELGVTLYDTSNLYGNGHSETLIGKAFQKVRPRVVLASKGGFFIDGEQDFSPRHLRESLEGSLERLQTDYLDLFQLHSPASILLPRLGETLKALEDLKREGKIRAFGISVRSPDDGLVAARELHAPFLQINFSMIDQRARENGLLDLCAQSQVGFIARTPLCYGFLTGRYTSETVFPPKDHRSKWPRQQIALWASSPKLFASVLRDPQSNPAQVALRYCLSTPGISAVIPGMLTIQQVEENVPASDQGPLLEEELREIEKVYQENTFFIEEKGRETLSGTVGSKP